MNKNIWVIAQREFATRVWQRSFLLGTFLAPMLIVIICVATLSLMSNSLGEATRLAVVEANEYALGATLKEVLPAQKYRVQLIAPQAALDIQRQALLRETGFQPNHKQGKYDAVVVLTNGVLQGDPVEYFGSNASSAVAMDEFQRYLTEAVQRQRLKTMGLDNPGIKHAMKEVPFKALLVSQGSTEGNNANATFTVAYGILMLVYMGVLLFSSDVLSAVSLEKKGRIVVVLLSSLTPFQMMLGKVLGVGAVGAVKVLCWSLLFVFVMLVAPLLGDALNMDTGSLATYVPEEFSLSAVVVGGISFLLGYFLYAALNAAVAAICKDKEEAQGMATVLMVLAVVGLLMGVLLTTNPSSGLGELFLWVPFSTPFVLPVRWVMGVSSVTEVFLCVALLIASVAVALKVAARCFSVGLLREKASITWREMFSLLVQKRG